MSADPTAMPRRDRVDPQFDGHHERPFAELTAEERLDWLWEMIQLRRAGERAREAQQRRERSGGG